MASNLEVAAKCTVSLLRTFRPSPLEAVEVLPDLAACRT